MRRKKVVVIAAAAVLLAGALSFYFFYLRTPGQQTLARVNGEKITVEQFHRELGAIENTLQEMYKEEPAVFLDMIVTRVLLLHEAKKEGLSVPAKTYKDAATAPSPSSPEEALLEELMKKKFSTPPKVTQEEIETFYSLFKTQMGRKPLSEVAPFVQQLIQEGKQRQEVERFVEGLRKNAKVEVDQGRLKKIAVKPPDSNTADEFKKAVTEGKPVLVDFGANSCIPCRQMRPILKEIDKEYAGKTKVLIIDVYKFPDLAREYKVQLIPTLVFFDAKGKESFRHVGVMDKNTIVAKLKEMGMAT